MKRTPYMEAEYVDGYSDGLSLDNPWPSDNRSEFYKHSFQVGRAELLGKPIPAYISRKRAKELEMEPT